MAQTVYLQDPAEPGKLTVIGGIGGVLLPDSSPSSVPTLLPATTATTGGTLTAGTYFYVVTALGTTGESLASNEVSITTTGSTSTVTLTWQSVLGATGYRVYRGTSAGAENTFFAAAGSGAIGGSFTDTGAGGTAATPSKVSTYAPANGGNWAGRARGALLTVPHNSDKATYILGFTVAATAQADLFAIESGPFMVTRIRRIVIANPGVQTTAAAVAINLLRTTTAGTGGVVVPAPQDPNDQPFTGICRVAPTALGTAGTVLLPYVEVVPAAAVAASAGLTVIDLGGDSQLHKCATSLVGITNGIAFRHPGAAGAAGLSGWVEFTEEPF